MKKILGKKSFFVINLFICLLTDIIIMSLLIMYKNTKQRVLKKNF